MFKTSYPQVPTERLDFVAQITLDQGGPVEAGNDPACDDANILQNNAFIADTFHEWGATVSTETVPFSPYLAASICTDLMIFYRAEVYDVVNQVWLDLPDSNFEVEFDANRRVFTITKCGPISSIGDPECYLPAFTKIYTLRVVATVNNMIMTTDASLVFDVIIGPDCSDNAVTLF